MILGARVRIRAKVAFENFFEGVFFLCQTIDNKLSVPLTLIFVPCPFSYPSVGRSSGGLSPPQTPPARGHGPGRSRVGESSPRHRRFGRFHHRFGFHRGFSSPFGRFRRRFAAAAAVVAAAAVAAAAAECHLH